MTGGARNEGLRPEVEFLLIMISAFIDNKKYIAKDIRKVLENKTVTHHFDDKNGVLYVKLSGHSKDPRFFDSIYNNYLTLATNKVLVTDKESDKAVMTGAELPPGVAFSRPLRTCPIRTRQS